MTQADRVKFQQLAKKYKARHEGGLATVPARATRWPLDEIPNTLFPMPNRREMKPDRREQEQARRKWRNVLLRDAYWAIFVAVIVVGGAKLATRFFGG